MRCKVVEKDTYLNGMSLDATTEHVRENIELNPDFDAKRDFAPHDLPEGTRVSVLISPEELKESLPGLPPDVHSAISRTSFEWRNGRIVTADGGIAANATGGATGERGSEMAQSQHVLEMLRRNDALYEAGFNRIMHTDQLAPLPWSRSQAQMAADKRGGPWRLSHGIG